MQPTATWPLRSRSVRKVTPPCDMVQEGRSLCNNRTSRVSARAWVLPAATAWPERVTQRPRSSTCADI